MPLRLFSAFLLLTVFLRPVFALPPDRLAPGGWHLSTPHPADAIIEHPDPLGPKDVLRVTVTTPSVPFYQIQIIRVIPRAIPEGHRLRLRFSARSLTHNPMRVTVERNGPPYDPAALRILTLTSAWQDYSLGGVSPGYGPDGLSAHFQMGQQAGTVDLRGMILTDDGIDPAVAAARAAIGPAQTAARIEKYRKGLMTVRVVDSQGRPVPGASVQITQTRHAFLFGCDFFGLDPADTSPTQKAYQAKFTGLFNYATLPFYWGAFESTPGKPDYARLQTMAAWSVAHGVTVKGHPLVWHEVWPIWAPTDPDTAIPLLHARVNDLVPRYKDTIHIWDVLNEANGAATHTPPNGESQWIGRDGPAPVVETALGWARAAGQGLPETFLYNDYDTGDSNVALLTQLQKDGKLPDAIGLQSHMHGGEWPLTKLWAVTQTFAQFGRPIHYTETTVISGPRRANPTNGDVPDWNTTPEGETRQADYVTQFYTLLFSHPSVRAITWWDFSDLHAWQAAPAGLVRKDMSPKPAYTRLLNLIHHQWWTKTSAKTDSHGGVTRRVFYGNYTLTVTDAQGRKTTRRVSFPEAAPPMAVTVRIG
jgi:endo-1,4-beta-xylanase